MLTLFVVLFAALANYAIAWWRGRGSLRARGVAGALDL